MSSKKLGILQILLLMFKHSIHGVPKPIASLFTKKMKITIIIVYYNYSVAHFIPGLGNQKQHNYRTSTYNAILI